MAVTYAPDLFPAPSLFKEYVKDVNTMIEKSIKENYPVEDDQAVAQALLFGEFTEHLESKPIVGTVGVQQSIKGKPVAPVVEQVHKLHEGIIIPAHELCSLHFGGGHTINLGNFESVKINVSITMPCKKEDLEEVYEFATNWVSEKISQAVAEAKGE